MKKQKVVPFLYPKTLSSKWFKKIFVIKLEQMLLKMAERNSQFLRLDKWSTQDSKVALVFVHS